MLRKSVLSLSFLVLLSSSVSLLKAQDYSLTMSIGNASGSLGNKTGLNNGEIFNSFGGGFQMTQGNWLYAVAFRQFAGMNWVVSTIPHTNATGTGISAAGTWSNRMRKSDALGLDASIGYSVNLGLSQPYYTYIGARLQRYNFRQVDLGSTEVWASNTATSPTSTAVIADNFQDTKLNFNPMFVIGYNFNNQYFGQLNLVQSSFPFRRASASGLITELSLGIKF